MVPKNGIRLITNKDNAPMSLHHSHCSQYRFSSNNKYVLTHTDIAWIITKNKIITTINFYTPSWFINYLFKNATGVLAAARKSAMLTKYFFARLPHINCLHVILRNVQNRNITSSPHKIICQTVIHGVI